MYLLQSIQQYGQFILLYQSYALKHTHMSH